MKRFGPFGAACRCPARLGLPYRLLKGRCLRLSLKQKKRRMTGQASLTALESGKPLP
jgi:hypothetical protein